MDKTAQPFDPSSKAVIINPDASALDLADMITERFSQMEAMLVLTRGEAGEEFRNSKGELQGDYMWMIDRTLRETRNLLNALWDQQRKK